MPFMSQEQIEAMIAQKVAEALAEKEKENAALRAENKALKEEKNLLEKALAVNAEKISELKTENAEIKSDISSLTKEITEIKEGREADRAETRRNTIAHHIELKDKLKEASLEGVALKAQNYIKDFLKAEECTIYCIDPVESDKLFSVGFLNDRIYTTAEHSNALIEAFGSAEVQIEDNNAVIPFKSKVFESKSNKETGEAVQEKTPEEKIVAFAIVKNAEQVDQANIFGKNAEYGSLFCDAFGEKNTEERFKQAEKESKSNKVTGYPDSKAFADYSAVIDEYLSDNKPVSFISIDVDFFKGFNDDYSHKIGDETLSFVLDTMRQNLRESERGAVFHLHGEEMLISIPADNKTAWEVSERLRKALENSKLMLTEQEGVSVRASFGVSTITSEDVASKDKLTGVIEKAVNLADERLIAAKENGRNQVVGSPETMQEKKSATTPTTAVWRLLNSANAGVVQDENGFMLEEKKARGVQGKNEKVTEATYDSEKFASNVVEWLENSQNGSAYLTGLATNLSAYCNKHNVENMEMFFDEANKGGVTANEWKDVLEQVSNMTNGKLTTELEIAYEGLSALTDKTEEIVLEGLGRKDYEWLKGQGLLIEEEKAPVPTEEKSQSPIPERKEPTFEAKIDLPEKLKKKNSDEREI